MSKVDQQFLKEHFTYREGKLFWARIPKNYRKDCLGKRFGSKHNKGYHHGTIKSKKYLEHRLIWLYHYGEWPKDQLDHINGIRDDNRIENLRECNNSENQYNRKSARNSSSKYKGVSWYPKYGKWLANFTVGGKKKFIGYYECEIEAAKAYREAVKPHQTEFRKVFEA